MHCKYFIKKELKMKKTNMRHFQKFAIFAVFLLLFSLRGNALEGFDQKSPASIEDSETMMPPDNLDSDTELEPEHALPDYPPAAEFIDDEESSED
jgi:hypothetical protein